MSHWPARLVFAGDVPVLLRETFMAQAALQFDSAITMTGTREAQAQPAADDAGLTALAFEIGWDHAHYRLVPPAEHLHEGNPVRQGWQAAQQVFGNRTLRATPQVRLWLQLRLQAWLRGQAFETVQVTPNFLGQIEVGVCPVTRRALTHGLGKPTDAVVERMFNGAGFAAGNLAMLSAEARDAKGELAWSDALANARRIEAGEAEDILGLGAAEWMRLAVMMSLATPLAHEQVASLPLAVLPPNRLRVLNPVQALQLLLTLQFMRAGYARRMVDIAVAMPAVARQEYHVLMHTLLARRVAAGPQADLPTLRRTMEDAWSHPLVVRRWQRLALRLTEADCERIVQHADRRGLTGTECRLLDRAAAVDGWAIAPQAPAQSYAAPSVAAASAAAASRAPSRSRLASNPNTAPAQANTTHTSMPNGR